MADATTMRIFAVANKRAVVGKTTTTTSLGAALAERDKRVLIVDLDPQGNATTGLGVDGRQFERSVYDVLLNDVPMVDIVETYGLQQPFRRSGNTRPPLASNRAHVSDLSRVAIEEGFNLRRGGF